jgi:hypothetical protein
MCAAWLPATAVNITAVSPAATLHRAALSFPFLGACVSPPPLRDSARDSARAADWAPGYRTPGRQQKQENKAYRLEAKPRETGR